MFISHFAVPVTYTYVQMSGGSYTFLDYLSFVWWRAGAGGSSPFRLFGVFLLCAFSRKTAGSNGHTAVAVCYAEQPATPLGNGVFIVVVTDYCVEKGRRPPVRVAPKTTAGVGGLIPRKNAYKNGLYPKSI